MKQLPNANCIRLIAGVLLSVFAVSACTESGPPLLRNVTAASGWVGACPPQNEFEERLQAQGLALSPELNSRLFLQFPPGSTADYLVKALNDQGFKLSGSCQNDPSILEAIFEGNTGSIFDTWAAIYWKVDIAHNIVWTKGFVAFEGL